MAARASKLETLFFDTSITDEGTQNDSIRTGCGSKDFERGKQGAKLLISMTFDRASHAVNRGRNEDERETKEGGECDLPLEG